VAANVRQHGKIQGFNVITRIIGAFLFLGVPVIASGAPDPAAELQKGMPGLVAGLISRIVDCNHWSGEEGYDAARRAEINRAFSELRCEDLEKDENVILEQYGSNPAVRRSIKAAKDLYL
jgi:hypothetical protein